MSFSVVIPSRNVRNLVPCAEAVRKHEPAARIIIVDDGLGMDWLPQPKLMPAIGITGVKPFVFARNVNMGIRAAGTDDVVILNDDALLETPGGFSLLAREAAEHPEYGLIASTCNNVGNPNQWPMKIGFREEKRMVCFVAVLIPRRTIDAVGMLDERYVGYGCDDDDYSFTVRKIARLKLGIHDGCYVDHGSLTSSFRGPAGAGGNYIPNLRLFIEKWGTDNWEKDRQHSNFPGLFPDSQFSGLKAAK